MEVVLVFSLEGSLAKFGFYVASVEGKIVRFLKVVLDKFKVRFEFVLIKNVCFKKISVNGCRGSRRR